MLKHMLFLSLMLVSLGASAATNRAVKITSKVDHGVSLTRVFNGSLFTTVCQGEIRVLLSNQEVVVQEVKKLIVPGNSIKQLTVSLEEEIMDTEANLTCYL